MLVELGPYGANINGWLLHIRFTDQNKSDKSAVTKNKNQKHDLLVLICSHFLKLSVTHVTFDIGRP